MPSFEVVGVLLAAAAIGPALLSVTLGAMVDRFGARKTYLSGTVATIALAAAVASVTTYWWLLPLQLLLGTLGPLGDSLQTYVMGLTRGKAQATLVALRISAGSRGLHVAE